MRRNILTYKAPPNNEGYDLICIHPDPKKVTKQIRVQVKSRYQTDSNRGLPLKGKSLDAFDYVVLVFQNIGYYYSKNKSARDGLSAPEFYTLPVAFVRSNHTRIGKGWEVFRTGKLDLTAYKDERGFEQIANELKVPYPDRTDVIQSNDV
jgi:hypothetical protein